MSYSSDSNRDRRQDRDSGLFSFLLMLLVGIAVFLLTPGMMIMAILADVFSLSLRPTQMWAFSFGISVCIFIALRIRSSNTLTAGKHYALTSGILTTLFILLLFGFEAPFAKRTVARFAPPQSENPETGEPRTTSSAPADRIARNERFGSAGTTPPSGDRLATAALEPAAPLNSFYQSTPQAPSLPLTYSITGVRSGDTLNVRNGPGTHYQTIGRLPNGAAPIHVIGRPVMNGSTEWVRIAFGRNQEGWVSRVYLKAEAVR